MTESGGKQKMVSKEQAAEQVNFATESYVPTPEIKALWTSIHDNMRNEFGEAVFRSWLKPMIL